MKQLFFKKETKKIYLILFLFLIYFIFLVSATTFEDENIKVSIWTIGTLNNSLNQNFTFGPLKNPSHYNFYFYSNYSNLSNFILSGINNSNCNISFNETGIFETPNQMQFNSTSGFWEFNRSFNYKGFHEFIINCTSDFGNASLIDNFTVLNTPPRISKSVGGYVNLDEGYLSCTEDTICIFNFSEKVTEDDYNDRAILMYLLNTSLETTLTNFTLNSNGILEINKTILSGDLKEKLNFQVNDNMSSDSATLEVRTTALNDAPEFISLTNASLEEYELFNYSFNIADEENDVPFVLNISFLNCSTAEWSSRGSTNCTLFNESDYIFNSTTGLFNFNFTPTHDDVGIYTINFSVMDYNGTRWKDNSTNSQVYYFQVNSSLQINVSDCQNKLLNESQEFFCIVNITTISESEKINVSTNASLRNYFSSAYNSSWFYSIHNFTSSGNHVSVEINITPGKNEVGNWSIDFNVLDSFNNLETEKIYVYVNRTFNEEPFLDSVLNINTSTNIENSILLRVYDNDFLIPDKNEGYNETLFFNYTIFNSSFDLVNFSNLSLSSPNYPTLGTNKSEPTLKFTLNSSEGGDYIFNLTISDKEGSEFTRLFNISAVTNNAPVWNESLNYFFNLTANSTFLTTENFTLNLTGLSYVSDSEGDNLTFAYTTLMQRFIMAADGLINFTTYKEDVGVYSVNITASDSFGLSSIKTFTFNTTNINSLPNITSIQDFNTTEDNLTSFIFYVYDDDLLIKNKEIYRENISINYTIEGINNSLFNIDRLIEVPNKNFSRFNITFTPSYLDIGEYNITLNVSDMNNESDSIIFKLSIKSSNDAPEFINPTTLYAGIDLNNSLYYRFLVSDEEDGNSSEEGNLNFTFSYNFVNGADFIELNESIFNSSLGEINYTFNESQAGVYLLNISVNDSEAAQTSGLVTIYVYNYPKLVYSSPLNSTIINMTENITSFFTLKTNHSIKDNLTYSWFVEGTQRDENYTFSNFGNETEVYWNFTPNFTDETTLKNLTNISLVISNRYYNSSYFWLANISHSNSPLINLTNIPSRSGGSPQLINLTLYFWDDDIPDLGYNQEVGFSFEEVLGDDNLSSGISVAITNWSNSSEGSVLFSSSSSVSGSFKIIAYEYNGTNSSDIISNITSNIFNISLVKEVVLSPVPSSGGSSSTTKVKLNSIKIITPGEVTLFKEDHFEVPIKILNDGEVTLTGINLSSFAFFNDLVDPDVKASMERTYIDVLNPGDSENLIVSLGVNADRVGRYRVTVYANVSSPKFYDWGDFYVEIPEMNETRAKEVVIFAEKLLFENPECLELREILKQAEQEMEKGDYEKAVDIANDAVEACKMSISSGRQLEYKTKKSSEELLIYLLIFYFIAILIGIFVFLYKKIKFNKEQKNDYI